MTGAISGGWGFVVAAYAITLIVFVSYTISLLVRLRNMKASSGREDIRG